MAASTCHVQRVREGQGGGGRADAPGCGWCCEWICRLVKTYGRCHKVGSLLLHWGSHTLWGGLQLLRSGRGCQAAWQRRQPWQQLCRWWMKRSRSHCARRRRETTGSSSGTVLHRFCIRRSLPQHVHGWSLHIILTGIHCHQREQQQRAEAQQRESRDHLPGCECCCFKQASRGLVPCWNVLEFECRGLGALAETVMKQNFLLIFQV